MEQSVNFSERLKNLRKEKKLSQKKLAQEVKVTRATIGYYENRKRKPDLEKLIKLADFFDVSIDFLAGKSNQQKGEEQIKNEIEISDPIKQKLINSNLSLQKLDSILNNTDLIQFINSYCELGNKKAKKVSSIVKEIIDIIE